MYGLPADFDATVFIGTELERVSFTANTVHLAFARDVAITLESTFALRSDDAGELIEQTPPFRASTLMSLIGRRVCSASATRSGTLRLDFTGGGTLVCRDDSPQYESYHLRVGDKEITV